MTLHHRAVIRGYGYSRTLGCDMLKSESDIGYAWGTKWQDDERVAATVRDMECRGWRVTVDTRDAG